MESLLPRNYYHLFNRAIGNENLFLSERNFDFFLNKYKKYVHPVADTFAFCLMSNHFHFLIRIKNDLNTDFSKTEIRQRFNGINTYAGRDEFISRDASKQFSNLFSSYTQAFNKENSRKGSLFIKNFKRKLVDDNKYLLRLVNYIHFNPVTHGFVENPRDWKYSSFNTILSDKPTLMNRNEVLEWFEGAENFNYCHRYPLDI